MPIWGSASRGLRLGIAALASLGLAAVAAPGWAAGAAEGAPGFCESRSLHDYLTPLRPMPKLRELPFRREAEARFRGVHIGASGPSLAVNGGSAGYQLQWDKNPGWEVAVTLAQVKRDGTVVRWLGQRRLHLARLAPALITEPHFALSGKPAFYRTTLVIRARSGRKLAEFGNYYRVVRPKIDARLVAESATYQPGETVFARLENRAAAFVLFGDGFTVEGLQGETWGPVPELPAPIGTPLRFVAPGTTGGDCLAFPIPTSMPAGRYRLAQESIISWPYEERERRPMLYAEFEVAAAAPQ